MYNPGLYLLLFALSLYVHQCYARSRSGSGSYRAGKLMVVLALFLFGLVTTVGPDFAQRRFFAYPPYC